MQTKEFLLHSEGPGDIFKDFIIFDFHFRKISGSGEENRLVGNERAKKIS